MIRENSKLDRQGRQNETEQKTCKDQLLTFNSDYLQMFSNQEWFSSNPYF